MALTLGLEPSEGEQNAGDGLLLIGCNGLGSHVLLTNPDDNIWANHLLLWREVLPGPDAGFGLVFLVMMVACL